MADAVVDKRVYGYSELLALIGGDTAALPEPYRIADTGVTFEPDPAAWATLTDDERLAVMPAGWRPGLPVLAFPCSASEIQRFADAATIPALLRWCEQDSGEVAAFEELSMHPAAYELAVLLAGGSGPASDVQKLATYTIAKKPGRRDVMAMLIERAQAEAGDPWAPAEVFGILRGWAREKPPSHPMMGLPDVGLQWHEEHDEVQELSRRNLGRRMRRQRSGPVA